MEEIYDEAAESIRKNAFEVKGVSQSASAAKTEKVPPSVVVTLKA